MKPTPQATIRLLLFTLALTVSLISTSGAQVWEDSVEMTSGETANYVSQHHPLKRIIVGAPDMVHVDVIAKDEIVHAEFATATFAKAKCFKPNVLKQISLHVLTLSLIKLKWLVLKW